MDGTTEPVLMAALPLIVGMGAVLIGIVAMIGSCRFKVSTERSALVALLALLGLFAVFYWFVGAQMPVILVLGVVGLGFAVALVIKRVCTETKRHRTEGI